MRYWIIFVVLASAASAADLPDFGTDATRWLESKTLAIAPEKPVFIFVFARDCSNCRRSHEFVNQMYAQYGGAVTFIGVHTPEFEWEKDAKKLKAYLARFSIRYAVYRDDDMAIWLALRNRYWPTFYVFDKQHRLAATYIGETHVGENSARQIESAILKATR